MMTRRRVRDASLAMGMGVLALGLTLPSSVDAKCECNRKMEAKLESQFSYYADENSRMEFDFDVEKQSRHVEVGVLGQDFDARDPDWSGKNDQAFNDFLWSIGATVSSEMEKPMVRLHVFGDDGEKLAVFRYE